MTGKAWVAKDYVYAFDIIVQDFWTSPLDPEDNAKFVMKGVSPDFAEENSFKDAGYTFIVAGHNFAGGGKSIEHVTTGLMGAGIQAVLADSFSRLQFRNAINYGLPFVTCKGINEIVNTGDEIEWNAVTGEVKNLTTGATAVSAPVPDFVKEVAQNGGMIAYIQKVIQENRVDEL